MRRASAFCFSVPPTLAKRTTKRSLIKNTSFILETPSCIKMRDSKGMSLWSRKLASRKKKPRGRELTDEEKQANRRVSSIRVYVEHALAGVKRSRMVKDTFRNKKDELCDIAMDISCGLHNLRLRHRPHGLKL